MHGELKRRMAVNLRKSREAAFSHRQGPEDDVISFVAPGYAFSIAVRGMSSAHAEAYHKLQERDIVGVLRCPGGSLGREIATATNVKTGESIGIIFSGGDPNLLLFAGGKGVPTYLQKVLPFVYDGPDFGAPAYTEEQWKELGDEIDALLEKHAGPRHGLEGKAA